MPIKQLRISKAASISLLGTLVAVFASPLNAEDQKRPNILFIIADDQSPFDLKIYDPKSPLDTPRIDQLAREGMILDGAYHMGAWLSGVCVPSRHIIMSGRTLWHAPNRPGRADNPHANDPSKVPTDIVQNTLPAVFNRAGCDTMCTCKRGNSFEAANVLFADRRDADKRGGTHESGSGWHGDRVLEYLDERESSQDTDPFLIYFGFSHPHDTRDGKSELLTKYGAVNHTDPNTLPLVNSKQPKLPPNYLTGHPSLFDYPELGTKNA